jgi:hypothetical protein
MTEIRPAANADAARWLLRADVDWWDLVRYGPPGFDVYVRIAFAQDADGVDPAGEQPALRVALAIQQNRARSGRLGRSVKVRSDGFDIARAAVSWHLSLFGIWPFRCNPGSLLCVS